MTNQLSAQELTLQPAIVVRSTVSTGLDCTNTGGDLLSSEDLLSVAPLLGQGFIVPLLNIEVFLICSCVSMDRFEY